MAKTSKTTPVEFTEEENLKLASQIASANLLFAQQALSERIIEPSMTTKGLLDIAEHSYRVSGMAKKQEPVDQTARFVFNIIMGNNETLKIEKEISGELVADSPATLSDAANTLVDSLSFDNAPEFLTRG